MPHTNTLSVEPVGDRDLLITRGFNAPRSLVFRAFTTPALVQQWLLGPGGWTMPVCEIDLRPGGAFRYVWKKGDAEMGMRGTFREIVRPARIVHTEVFDQDWTGGETTVTTVFDEVDRRTVVSMTVRYSSAEARAGAMKSGMTDGMGEAYERLDAMFASGTMDAA
jgi:uncharacterized protein YndB with AHSA1/START domain